MQCTFAQLFVGNPVHVEAMRWTGDNTRDVALWVNPKLAPFELPKGWRLQSDRKLVLPGPDGERLASIGDWIIKGVNGEFYPCKPDIFAKTYEPVEE